MTRMQATRGSHEWLYKGLYYHTAENVFLLVLGHDSIYVLKNVLFIAMAAHPLWDTEYACHDGHEFQLPHVSTAS